MLQRAVFVAITLTTVALAAHAAKLPGVDLNGIAPEDFDELMGLMREGACPCVPAQTLHQCIVENSCPQATDLARYGADKFREGLGADQVREAVVKRYMAEHVKYDIDVAGAPRKGAESGRIVIVEFADFQCPHCALIGPMIDRIIKKHPKDITLYFKNFPLPGHPHSETAARACWAAGRQDRFWEMHDIVFKNQAVLIDGSFSKFARELGLNVEKFESDLGSPAAHRYVRRDQEEAIKHQLGGTPTLIINGRMFLEDKTEEAIVAHIEQLLARSQKNGK